MTRLKMAKNESGTSAKAVLKNIRVSPRKANLLAGLIRGKTIPLALSGLMSCRRRFSTDVSKLLLSAVSNAENNHNLDVDLLFVREAFVGKGVVMKRWHARGRGRGAKVWKFASHFTIVVDEEKVRA